MSRPSITSKTNFLAICPAVDDEDAMSNLAYRLYWGAERIIVPGLRYSQDSYEDALRDLINSNTVWLDVGCGYRVLSEWRLEAERELVKRAAYVAGVDMDAAAVAKHRTVQNIRVGSADSLPFPDESFNLVTANMVVEHLANPCQAFAEICRVLSPGGLFLFHTPNSGGYLAGANKFFPDGFKKLAAKVLDGRTSADVYPTYYRCNSEQTIVPTADSSGLAVKRITFLPTTAVFARVLPIAAFELLWIRATMRGSLAQRRANILGLLSKPA
jgi:SAM-dependent methyltransferase